MIAPQQAARRNRRPKKRELFCPVHPEQLVQGNGRKYYLHLIQPEQLLERCLNAKKARLIYQRLPGIGTQQ